MDEEEEQPSEEIARLMGLIDSTCREMKVCPACGFSGWDYGLAVVSIPQRAPNPHRRGLTSFPLICRQCGYVRLHSVEHLLRQSSEDPWDHW